ncbi:YqaA family protein [Candidatus Pantoea multigeneris]|uniref:DedA family protein n=1 Tax=Candidatus Pantoea multigeneris TaxID=2608357 RepID=A0ABX0RD77_9GAMM|nr:DedA family protein [Pantoea multigeneris]
MTVFLANASLFSSSFLSATLLPGSSEALLVTLLIAKQASVFALVTMASLGNTLGGLTNIIIGRLLPLKQQGRWHQKAITWLNRLGPAALLFSWLPLIGDVLCVLAGWLRLAWGPVVLYLAIGKTLRYVVIAMVTLQGMQWWH